MFPLIGLIVVIASVVGGYLLSHGNLLALWQPYELIIIAGAALGAFFIANPPGVAAAVFRNVPTIVKGSPYSKAMYLDLLALLYELFVKARKDGLMSIESDIDDVAGSAIFVKYPKITANHHVTEFITDYLRLMVAGNMNPYELENLMDVELDTHHEENELPVNALTRVAEGLPGFGIVAAVLGIVITMASLDGPVEEIGVHVAAALVGTFLGILLAYGFVGPAAAALEHLAREQTKFLGCIKVCLMATLNGYSPQIAVEFGRKVMYARERPKFQELEAHVKEKH